MKSILVVFLALAVVNAQDIKECVTKFQATMEKAHTFGKSYVEAKIKCMETECKEPLAPIAECLPVAKMQEKMAMMQADITMFSQAVKTASDMLLQPGACRTPERKYTSLREVLADKGDDHFFDAEHCMGAMIHRMVPKPLGDCMAKCMVSEMKGTLTLENFDAKLAWLANPDTAEVPQFMKDMDLKSAALCVVNACDQMSLTRVLRDSGLMRMIMMKAMMEGELMKSKMNTELVGMCTCAKARVPEPHPFLAAIDCQNFPESIKKQGECAANMRVMVQDMKTAFEATAAGGK